MKKILAAAGVASLIVTMVPLVAQAASIDHAQQNQTSRFDRYAGNSHHSHDADRSNSHDRAALRAENHYRDVRRHREVRRERVERRHAVQRWNHRMERRYAQAELRHERAMVRHDRHREFRHWRPGLERAHYRHFSAPVYYNGYYQVQAHDRGDRVVLLMISALTGAIIASSY